MAEGWEDDQTENSPFDHLPPLVCGMQAAGVERAALSSRIPVGDSLGKIGQVRGEEAVADLANLLLREDRVGVQRGDDRVTLLQSGFARTTSGSQSSRQSRGIKRVFRSRWRAETRNTCPRLCRASAPLGLASMLLSPCASMRSRLLCCVPLAFNVSRSHTPFRRTLQVGKHGDVRCQSIWCLATGTSCTHMALDMPYRCHPPLL